MGAIIRSVGTYSPQRILTNQDLERILALSGEETSDEWIVERTGIKKRRIAREDESNATMAVEAARDALSRLNEDIPPIEYIILATNTNERLFPNGVGFVQAALRESHPGMIKSTAAGCDLNAGCGAINFAHMQADALIQSGFFETILVIGAEKLSSVTDYSDRGTCILFGDGASAYLLSKAMKDAGFMGHDSRGDGAMREAIRCEWQKKVTFYEAIRALDEQRVPVKSLGWKLIMDGRAVFKYVQREFDYYLGGLKNNRKLNPQGIDFSSVGWINPHLANRRNLEGKEKQYPGFLEKCGLDGDSSEHFCNTSTASQGRRAREFHETARPGEYNLTVGYGAEVASCAGLYRKP